MSAKIASDLGSRCASPVAGGRGLLFGILLLIWGVLGVLGGVDKRGCIIWNRNGRSCNFGTVGLSNAFLKLFVTGALSTLAKLAANPPEPHFTQKPHRGQVPGGSGLGGNAFLQHQGVGGCPSFKKSPPTNVSAASSPDGGYGRRFPAMTQRQQLSYKSPSCRCSWATPETIIGASWTAGQRFK